MYMYIFFYGNFINKGERNTQYLSHTKMYTHTYIYVYRTNMKPRRICHIYIIYTYNIYV